MFFLLLLISLSSPIRSEKSRDEKFEYILNVSTNIETEIFDPVFETELQVSEYIRCRLNKLIPKCSDEFEEHKKKKQAEQCYLEAKNFVKSATFYISFDKEIDKYDFERKGFSISYSIDRIYIKSPFGPSPSALKPGYELRPLYTIRFSTFVKFIDENEAQVWKRKINNKVRIIVLFRIVKPFYIVGVYKGFNAWFPEYYEEWSSMPNDDYWWRYELVYRWERTGYIIKVIDARLEIPEFGYVYMKRVK